METETRNAAFPEKARRESNENEHKAQRQPHDYSVSHYQRAPKKTLYYVRAMFKPTLRKTVRQNSALRPGFRGVRFLERSTIFFPMLLDVNFPNFKLNLRFIETGLRLAFRYQQV